MTSQIRENFFLIATVESQLENDEETLVTIKLQTDFKVPLLLHWGVGYRSPKDWNCPAEDIQPEGTTVFDKKLSAQTKFVHEESSQTLTLSFKSSDNPIRFLNFVLKELNSVNEKIN